ncbi:MAG TPA: ribonuclease E/G, partial [Myxococcota bacterium]|nr:ribonuclease E/G [Myxococcota bacterium]
RQKDTLQAYSDREPIFDRFGVEQQLEQIHGRSVPLPSGGSLVIDSTEALVAIDVNSGKTKSRGGQEVTVYETNLEAAREVARQLRLRDLGGIVVIDFIDMSAASHRSAVDKALRDAMKADKARHQLGKISSFGLCTLTRQRLGRALSRTGSIPCPTCTGSGRVRDQESVALRVLRRIRAEASAGGLGGVRVRLHPALAEHLQNRHRADLLAVERQLGIQVSVVGNPSLAWGQEEVDRLSRDGSPRPERNDPPERRDRHDRPGRHDHAEREDRPARTPPPAPPAPAAASPEGPPAVETPAEGAAPADPNGRSRRRRRRRRKRSDGAGPLPQSAEGSQAAAGPEVEMEDGAPETEPSAAPAGTAGPAPAPVARPPVRPAELEDDENYGNRLPPEPEDDETTGNLVEAEPEVDGNLVRTGGDHRKRRRRRRRRRPGGGSPGPAAPRNG